MHQVDAIREVGRQDHIVAIEMLYHAVLLQRHHPAGVLMHAVINDKNGVATPQRRFYQKRRI